MAHLIDKDVLVVEIEKYKKEALERLTTSIERPMRRQIKDKAWVSLCQNLLLFINSLDVKEVDNVWHNANETPKGTGDKEILVQFADSHASVLEIDDWEYLDHQTKWAYLKDLI